jgi:hypothetical protein
MFFLIMCLHLNVEKEHKRGFETKNAINNGSVFYLNKVQNDNALRNSIIKRG